MNIKFAKGQRVRITRGHPFNGEFAVEGIKNADGQDQRINLMLPLFGSEPGQPVYEGTVEGELIAVPQDALEAV